MSSPDQIKFPVVWNYRIILESSQPASVAAIKDIFADFDPTINVETGSASGGGKYQSYYASALVNSLEELRELSGRIERVPGVKFLL